MTRVIGPDGRGVVVATADPRRAAGHRVWLEDRGIPAEVPADLGLRAMPRSDQFEPGADPRLEQARFWATAVRRPSVVVHDDIVSHASPGGDAGVDAPDAVLDLLERSLDVMPPRRIAVFGGAWVREDEPEYAEAAAFARRCAEAGVEVVTGGYGGVMGAASRAASDAGGAAIGITVGTFSERVPVNESLTHEIQADDVFARFPLICDAEAWVAFPGGVGTLTEIALCWSLVQTGSVSPRPLVIVGQRWDRALATFRELLLAEHVHFDLIRPAPTGEEAFGLVAG
ncbi:MAG: LOG family protein [Actinomycetota bacterium]|nr:LOG family protein [Actinomycetota bacterium]